MPERFGAPSVGTSSGFGDRVAAVRFESFPSMLGREAVLTRGFPLIDVQAVGGLYDFLGLEIFPDPIRSQVVAALPRLSAKTFCAALARASHLDINSPLLAGLTANQRAAVGRVDAMRNVDPRVVRCALEDGVIVFDKETAFAPGFPRQHIFGAVRFLEGDFSTFQLIGGGAPPDAPLLAEMAGLVRSFTLTP